MTAKEPGHEHATSPLQGRRFERLEGAERLRVLAEVVDYRGDVTLGLDDGSVVSGYVFGVEPEGASPHVKLLPSEAGASKARVPLARIVACEFTGRDTADGRSWEAWVRRYEEKKRLAAQGIDVGDIEPKPEEL